MTSLRRRPRPESVTHTWERTTPPGTWECKACGQWTANLPPYRDEVCPVKDRRRIKDRRVQEDN